MNGLRDRREVFQIPSIDELVDHAHGVRRVVDDVPGYGRPDESGSAGDNDTVHFFRNPIVCAQPVLKQLF